MLLSPKDGELGSYLESGWKTLQLGLAKSLLKKTFRNLEALKGLVKRRPLQELLGETHGSYSKIQNFQTLGDQNICGTPAITFNTPKRRLVPTIFGQARDLFGAKMVAQKRYSAIAPQENNRGRYDNFLAEIAPMRKNSPQKKFSQAFGQHTPGVGTKHHYRSHKSLPQRRRTPL